MPASSSDARLKVVVTGGSRGIGLAIADRLASAGYDVLALARRSSDELDALAARAPEDDRGAVAFMAADLGAIATLPDLARAIRREFGPVYGLVNNAGLGTEGILATMRETDIEALIRLNVQSPIVLTKHVMRAMMAAGRGRIVTVSSIIASTGYNALSVYAATKAAALGFTRSLARELGPLNITVNAVAPGFVETAMTEGLDSEDRARIARRSALGRLAEAGDVAAAVEFLMGPGARNVTGTVLTVDAGNTA